MAMPYKSTLPPDESGKLTGQPIRKRLEAETWRSKCHKMNFYWISMTKNNQNLWGQVEQENTEAEISFKDE